MRIGGPVADRGVIAKSDCALQSRFDSGRFDTRMTAARASFFTGATAMRYGQPEDEVCQRKVCEMRQACCTGTSYDPEPISGEATP